MPKKGSYDVEVQCEGTIMLLHLNTNRATNWVGRHVHDPHYFGDALVVEPRYFGDVASAMQRDGLTFSLLRWN